ncbi:uncharacterized protein DFL_002625 [Arthrobotrys flagrans]|uniref:A to I editase domain-containing protein n=1 Tax=Arthrobotrys flagrans TaxID=97331 RepID=A0A437AC99_ARTFL|nr:hypothetical protein DFL_002625 [Arthrobotrys flagrans]
MPMAGNTLEERIATLSLKTFHSLPAKCKPRPREWIPMTAIVLQTDDKLHLASLATGSKCIPSAILPRATGLILHDCHSEILALRGLNHFLLQDAHQILTNPDYRSPYLIYNDNYDPDTPPFTLHPSTSIHLFSTEPPCGDASMEFIISAQQDPTPWSLPTTDNKENLPGRSYFSALSIVRRKPSRPDAPATLSKSCTDKLTLKQLTSILSSPSSIVISPTENAYIKTFTVPFGKYNDEGHARAFATTPPNGRLSNLPDILKSSSSDEIGGYSFNPLTPTPLPKSFPLTYTYSKPPPQDTTTKASNISTLYINHPSTPSVAEVLISGVKQGNAQLSTARGDKKGSVVCRKRTWLFLRRIVDLLPESHRDIKTKVENSNTYLELKAIDIHNTRSRIKMKHLVTEALNGWERNVGDDDWRL